MIKNLIKSLLRNLKWADEFKMLDEMQQRMVVEAL